MEAQYAVPMAQTSLKNKIYMMLHFNLDVPFLSNNVCIIELLGSVSLYDHPNTRQTCDVYISDSNSHTWRWNQKPSVIERDRTH